MQLNHILAVINECKFNESTVRLPGDEVDDKNDETQTKMRELKLTTAFQVLFRLKINRIQLLLPFSKNVEKNATFKLQLNF